MEIKVSVIMAVYNGEKYIEQALNTIITQTLKEIEILCVDDGSTDNTIEILKKYEKKDRRIRILRHLEKTDGAAEARNMGMDAAKGEYLSFLDADDFFKPDMLEKAYVRAKKTNAEVVVFDAYIYNDDTEMVCSERFLLNRQKTPNLKEFTPTECSKTLFRITVGTAWNGLFSHAMVTKNKLRFASIHHTDDQVFVYMAYALANKIAILPERLLYYRKNVPRSQSANAHLHPEAGYMAPYMLMQELKKRGIYEKYKIAVAELALEIAFWHITGMTNVENFHKLYFAMKDTYMRELGILELSKNDIQDKQLLLWRDFVMENAPEEYLLKWNSITLREKSLMIPKLSPQAKVAIYGAGDNGFAVFDFLVRLRICKVVAWVDRDYENIGFPIQCPEALQHITFDYVFIAIKADNVYKAVKTFLMEMKIPENKIHWIPEV